MHGNSRWVSSNQPGIHDKLADVVARHEKSASKKPIQQHTQEAFEQVQDWLKQCPDLSNSIILDSCCGIGESTWRLAQQYPNALIVGVDKSFSRLEKHGQQPEYTGFDKQADPFKKNAQQENQSVFFTCDNYCVVRADVIDFWRLVVAAKWSVIRHYIFYPNPYPKASQLQKRWHASASLQDILRIGGALLVRSNWDIYIKEFAEALAISGKSPQVTGVTQNEPMTPFERKYWNSGQQSWQVDCEL